MRKSIWILLCMIFLVVPFVSGQDFSLDPLSPETPAPFSAADILYNDIWTSVLVPSTWLGLIPTDNIDGLSYGTDFVTPTGPGYPWAVLFSVTRLTVGSPGGVVNNEVTRNGAAADIFWCHISSSGVATGPYRLWDAVNKGLSPLPTQSDINGMTELEGGTTPMTAYFSVDQITATRLGVSAADILYQGMVGPGTTPPTVYVSAAAMGLVPGDDIDAIAVYDVISPGTFGAGDLIFISLALGSPSLVTLAASPALIFEVSTAGITGIAFIPSQFELLASDDINALVLFDIACCSVAGDANHDGGINVGDAVFLIEYTFKGGRPPICPNEADSNNDGSVNLGDAVNLINYVFKGGIAPTCGSVY